MPSQFVNFLYHSFARDFFSKDDEVSKKKTEEYFDMAEERITWEQDNQMILVEKENAKQA